MTARTADTPPGRARTRGWALAGLVLLVLLGLLYVFGAVNDLAADAGGGIPVDHRGAYTALTGTSFAHTAASAPGIAAYVSTLETGYALHELTFALLFLAILLIPFRRRRWWAWWAAWVPMIANLGYTLTLGVHDPTILGRSLIADIALPVLLLAHLPAFLHRRDHGTPPPAAPCRMPSE